ncbi:helix-turn-helix domain-containing protein [bacterium]|nr:helix-turn-helix domain-containing protein [bacterium]
MSSYYEYWLEEREREAEGQWEQTPEGTATMLAVENGRLRAEKAALELKGQEREWRRRHPTEWRAWQRLQALLAPAFTFGDEPPFGFVEFRQEVGQPPEGVTRVVRKSTSLPYQQGNLRWGRPRARKTASLVTVVGAQAVQGAEKKDYLTKKEVAKRLGVSSRTVNRWMSEGLLKPFRRGQVLRFKLEDVEAFEAKGKGSRR